jgi:predicted ATPase
MLKRWSNENFKSFRNRTDLELAPINIFAGANNSGKSTIIQSILALKQTLQYAPANRPITLNGPLLKLGTFDDAKNQSGKSSYIGLSWTFDPAEPYRPSAVLSGYDLGTFPMLYWGRDEFVSATYEVRFDLGAPAGTEALRNRAGSADIAQLQPNLAYTSITATFKSAPNEVSEARIVLSRTKQLPDPTASPFEVTLTRSSPRAPAFLYDVADIDDRTRAQTIEDKPDARIVGANARHFFPLQIGIMYDKAKETARIISNLICSPPTFSSAAYRREPMEAVIPPEVIRVLEERFSQSRRGSLFPPRIFSDLGNEPVTLGAILRRLRSEMVRTPPSARISLGDLQPQIEAILLNQFATEISFDVSFPSEIITAAEYARFFFTAAVRYLGPLRDEPKPIYPLEGLANPTEVGYKGEHTAAVLHLHRETYIRYIPSSFIEELDKAPAVKTATLHDAVVDWLSYMGVVQEFSTGDLGKIGHNLQVRTSGATQLYDLTNVGVGVSQVLPIVVMALLAERPCFLIFEQPELHLHPRVQTRLADFFLSLALSGKQCLLETHSEYLVERCRRRIAEATGDTLVDVLKIYFTERSEGQTTCRHVDVSRYGAIADYPPDFFDQSQGETEAILQAARSKRASERTAVKAHD